MLSRGLRLKHLATRSFTVSRLLYSRPTPYPLKKFSIFEAISYAKSIDEQMDRMKSQTSNEDLVNELLPLIEPYPELLAVLLLFHYELSKLGVTRTSERTFTPLQIRRYRWAYLLRLRKIHMVFWSQCCALDISQNFHRLGFLPVNVGLLDPANFLKELYDMLQDGIYNDKDFRELPLPGGSWEQRKRVNGHNVKSKDSN